MACDPRGRRTLIPARRATLRLFVAHCATVYVVVVFRGESVIAAAENAAMASMFRPKFRLRAASPLRNGRSTRKKRGFVWSFQRECVILHRLREGISMIPVWGMV